MLNSHNPKISIVIATYNGALYLQEQLDSIAAQTLQPYEIIIQDDHSSDKTTTIIRHNMLKLPIKFYENLENLGYIRNFESALAKAEGDYIALCDQDDIWVPQKLELLMEAIGSKSLAYADSSLIDSEGNPLGKTLSEKLRNRFIEAESPLSFVYDNCVSAHAMLFRHSLLKHIFPFPKNLYFDAWIAACASSENGISYVDKALVGYRQHSSNTLSTHQKSKNSFFNTLFSKQTKKCEEHSSRVAVIDDLLQVHGLIDAERALLQKLKIAHASFERHWFNFHLMYLLLQNRSILFAITRRFPLILALKKSIGLKLYRFFPFL